MSVFPLKLSLSKYGFNSTESYDHAVRCFLGNPNESIRCMNVDGNCGRRRTAFAHALAYSLDVPHVLYYEFGKDKAVPQIIRIQEGEEVIEEPPVDAFDRILTEACAQSEAEQTILIIDQLHKTQFLNHIRLYEFLRSGVWHYSDVSYQANPHNLKVFLLSNEDLYHSLQGSSFRLWVHDSNESAAQISAIDLGLDDKTCLWFKPLQALFKKLMLAPTLTEYQHLIFDIEEQVRNEHQLKVSLFGWLENVNKETLESDEVRPYLEEILQAIQQGLDVHEEIEIFSI